MKHIVLKSGESLCVCECEWQVSDYKKFIVLSLGKNFHIFKQLCHPIQT